MDIRLKQLFVNLKNYSFDVLQTYKIDEKESKEIMCAIEDTVKDYNDMNCKIKELEDKVKALSLIVKEFENNKDKEDE